MNFYTVVLKQSLEYWVALCLESGIVGQDKTQNDAIAKLKEVIESLQEIDQTELDIYSAPISIKKLHEFLMLELVEPTTEVYELRAVSA